MASSNHNKELAISFLKNFPPFNLLKADQLKAIAEFTHIKTFNPDEFIFTQGEAPGTNFYVLQKGSVELRRTLNEQTKLIDVCDEGDVFGVRAMIANQPYLTDAQAVESTTVFAIPCEKFKPILSENPDVALFFAAGFAAGQPVIRQSIQETSKGHNNLSQKTYNLPSLKLSDISIQSSDELISCQPDTSIKDVAIKMNENSLESMVIINVKGCPAGIVTNTDFRNHVVTGKVSPDSPVKTIMTSPVKTILPNQPASEVMLQMMKAKVEHLCVTRDGSPNTEAIGVISEKDLLLIQGNSPSVLISEITKNKDVRQLLSIRNKADHLIKHYLEHGVSINFIAEMITQINDSITHKLITYAQKQLETEGYAKPNVKFCWVALGSEGREEQLLRSDQENAIIYEDPQPGQEKATNNYFVLMAKIINTHQIACGFGKGPSDLVASNNKWCLPLSRWKKYFSEWLYEPEPKLLALTAPIFDYRPVSGDFSLCEELTNHWQELFKEEKAILKLMAKNALLNPPPLGFFRNFTLEKTGEHKDNFDIKSRAIAPIVDATRVLSLEYNIKGEKRTTKRLEKMALLDPQKAKMYEEIILAYELLMKIRVLNGLRNNNSGQYINPEHLNKIERQTLRNAFKPIDELQEMMKEKYQVELS
jgi:CBS domain-containing protein